MNTRQVVLYEKKLANYLEKHQVQDTFHYLFRKLCLNKPDDPLSFLIEELRTKRKPRLIFLSGYQKDRLFNIADSLCTRLNLKHVSYFNYIKERLEDEKEGQKFKNDYLNNEILDFDLFKKLVNEVSTVESHFKGVLLEGFPNNMSQLVTLTKQSLIPERFFYVNFDKDEDLRENKKFLEKHKDLLIPGSLESVDSYLEKHRSVSQINVEQMKKAFPKMVTDVQGNGKNNQRIVQEIEVILSPKERALTPLRSPQILVLSLISSISQPIISEVAQKFGLVNVCTQELVQREIDRKGVLGEYCFKAMDKGKFIPDDVCCALAQSEIKKTHCQHLGWIMDGFPMNTKQFNKFISWRCPPHIIIVLQCSLEYILEKASQMKIHPETRKIYDLSKEKVDEDLQRQLQPLKTYTKENLQARQEIFDDMLQHMKQKFRDKLVIINPEETEVSKIHSRIHDMIQDPNFYN